jgi:uncharacterized Zn-finger protein
MDLPELISETTLTYEQERDFVDRQKDWMSPDQKQLWDDAWKPYWEFFYLGKETPVFTEKKRWRQPHQCQYCSRVLSNASNLIRHVRIHTGQRPFACVTCGKTFINSSNRRKHEKLHNKPPMQMPVLFRRETDFVRSN